MKLVIDPAMLKDRSKNLQKRLGKDITEYPENLTQFIFADFLELKHPLKKLLKVVSAAKRVDSFISQNPPYLAASPGRIELFDAWNISNKRDIIERYRLLIDSNNRYKQTRDKVLGNIYPNIVRFLSADARTGTNLAQAYSALIPLSEIEWLVSKRQFVDQVALQVAQNNPNITASIVKSMTYHSIFRRANTYDMKSIDETAKAISDFETLKATNPQAARLAELKAALSDNGVQYRSDSRFAQEYIACTVCVDLDEVVAVLKLTARLFAHSHAVWSHLHLVVEAQLVNKVFVADPRPTLLLGLGDVWITAVNEIVSSSKFKEQCSNVPIYSGGGRRDRWHDDWDEDEDDNGWGYGWNKRRRYRGW